MAPTTPTDQNSMLNSMLNTPMNTPQDATTDETTEVTTEVTTDATTEPSELELQGARDYVDPATLTIALSAVLDQSDASESVIKEVYENFPDSFIKFGETVESFNSHAIDEREFKTQMSILLPGRPDLQQDCVKYAIIRITRDPVAAEDASMNVDAPQQPSLAISMQPPQITRSDKELFPPLVVRHVIPEDNVWAEVTLISNGTDVTCHLRGQLIQTPSEGCFYFSGLKIQPQGEYHFLIRLYRAADQVAACIESDHFTIGPRPQPIEDIATAQDFQEIRQPLSYRTMGANTIIDDYTDHFTNLKINKYSSITTVEGTQYLKLMVLKLVSDYRPQYLNIDHGLYDLGDGLFSGDFGELYDDGEVECAIADKSVCCGDDGELYQRNSAFKDLLVGLERRGVVVDCDVYIAHIVLLETISG